MTKKVADDNDVLAAIAALRHTTEHGFKQVEKHLAEQDNKIDHIYSILASHYETNREHTLRKYHPRPPASPHGAMDFSIS